MKQHPWVLRKTTSMKNTKAVSPGGTSEVGVRRFLSGRGLCGDGGARWLGAEWPGAVKGVVFGRFWRAKLGLKNCTKVKSGLKSCTKVGLLRNSFLGFSFPGWDAVANKCAQTLVDEGHLGSGQCVQGLLF